MGLRSGIVLLLALALLTATAAAPEAGSRAEAQRPPGSSTSASNPMHPAMKPSRRRPAPLVFGIYPGGAAGTVGPAGRTIPEQAPLRQAALEQLRGGDWRFVLHLYDSYTQPSDAAAVPPWLASQSRSTRLPVSRSSSC